MNLKIINYSVFCTDVAFLYAFIQEQEKFYCSHFDIRVIYTFSLRLGRWSLTNKYIHTRLLSDL